MWSGPILDIMTWVRFLGHILWKSALCFLAPRKQMSFLTISNKNIFFKTQGTRLDAIVAPNKGQNRPWWYCYAKINFIFLQLVFEGSFLCFSSVLRGYIFHRLKSIIWQCPWTGWPLNFFKKFKNNSRIF